jgi:hypothetical protein
MKIIIGVLLLLSIAAVFMFTRIARKRVLGVREEIPDAKLVELFGAVPLPSETILEILQQIGACYGIAYAQLRPDDCFISQLSKIDSWRLDAGAEKLEKSLREKFEVTIPHGLKTFTILDLLKLVESKGHQVGSVS